MIQRCFYIVLSRLIMGCLLIITFSAYAQQADDILGRWQNPSGEGRIEIFKKENQYYGRLYWLKNPNNAQGKPKLDEKNSNPTLRSRPLV